MDLKTIFTKTAKGVTQVNQKTQSLSRDLMKVLKVIDGKSNVETLASKADVAVPGQTMAPARWRVRPGRPTRGFDTARA